MLTTVASPADQADKMLRGFADRTRLRILHRLTDVGRWVSELIDILRMSAVGVSHHLNYLRRAGLVQVRRRGLWRRLSEVNARRATADVLSRSVAGSRARAQTGSSYERPLDLTYRHSEMLTPVTAALFQEAGCITAVMSSTLPLPPERQQWHRPAFTIVL